MQVFPEQSTTKAERDQWDRDYNARHGWHPADEAPKDGTHILVCSGPYDKHWTFDQAPPCVVHYWSNPGEEGFYPSSGIVENSYNDHPVNFKWWCYLGETPHR